MNDDIVTRLRGAAAGFRIAVGTNDSFTFPTLHSEAADEIERLRTELADYKRTVRALEAELAEETSGYE